MATWRPVSLSRERDVLNQRDSRNREDPRVDRLPSNQLDIYPAIRVRSSSPRDWRDQDRRRFLNTGSDLGRALTFG